MIRKRLFPVLLCILAAAATIRCGGVKPETLVMDQDQTEDKAPEISAANRQNDQVPETPDEKPQEDKTPDSPIEENPAPPPVIRDPHEILQAAIRNAANMNGEADPDMAKQILTAVRMIGRETHEVAPEILWQVFDAFNNTEIRTEIVNTVISIEGGDKLESKLGELLVREDNFTQPVDYPLLRNLVDILGRMGTPDSYLPLFKILTLPYNEDFLSEVEDTLISIASKRNDRNVKNDLYAFLVNIILDDPGKKSSPAHSFDEKLAALRLGVRGNALTEFEKGALAEAALRAGMEHSGDLGSGRTLRLEAAKMIHEMKWVFAVRVALNYYAFAETAFYSVEIPQLEKDEYLEAISCLSAMNDAEAARVLSLRLGLLNSAMEFSGAWDIDIMLAMIKALGLLGYKSSFDNLNHIGLLAYPDTVKKSALDAVKRLQW
jgi:hypothetical protein